MSRTIIPIDRAGRLVVPKSLRDELHLVEGTRLTAEARDGALVLRVVDAAPALVKEDGWWVYRPTVSDEAALRDAVNAHRRDRLSSLSE
jgi:AbrB family looped-hinge helix DNA binding protein